MTATAPPPQRPLWLRAWAPTLIGLAVIACESTPMGGSQHTFRLVRTILHLFYPHLNWVNPFIANYFLRKGGHVTGYAILSVLAYRTWWTTWVLSWRPRLRRLPTWWTTFRVWLGRAAVLAFLTTAAVAGLDEWHQAFVPGRTSSIWDVALDSAAALCAQCLILALSNRELIARSRSRERAPKTETIFNEM